MNTLYDGFSLIPLNGKRPVGSWKKFQTERATDAQINEWFGPHNIGIVTGRISDLIVVDFDDKESAREWFKNHRSVIRVIVETRRGVHFYFRCPDGEVRNSTGTPDIRGEGGYVVGFGGEVDGHKYEFVDGFDDLNGRAVYQPEWFNRQESTVEPLGTIAQRAVRHYIEKIVSVSGERGHDNCFRTACKLRDSGLSEAEALAELIRWNETNSFPPWSTAELLHKIKSAFQKR